MQGIDALVELEHYRIVAKHAHKGHCRQSYGEIAPDIVVNAVVNAPI